MNHVNYRIMSDVTFPEPRDRVVNMMPFVFGERSTVPSALQEYWGMIELAAFEAGKLAYLTIHESYVPAGSCQRRPGIHTDATAILPWGGAGPWGGGAPPQSPKSAPKPAPKKPAPKPSLGIYMASTDGNCRVWDRACYDVDHGGAVMHDPGPAALTTSPNTLYWIHDRTPHESLLAQTPRYRQFFRLVSHEIGGWYVQHSTPNPVGVVTDAPLILTNKFEELLT